jgi:hypothetical protein
MLPLCHHSGAAAKKPLHPAGGIVKKDTSCRSREMSQKCKNFDQLEWPLLRRSPAPGFPPARAET